MSVWVDTWYLWIAYERPMDDVLVMGKTHGKGEQVGYLVKTHRETKTHT